MKTKFKGFSERLNKWVYGYLVEDCMIVNGIVEVNDQYISIESWETVVPESVGQYIGVKDCYDVEIFEGDIVMAAFNTGKTTPCKVAYNSLHARFEYVVLEMPIFTYSVLEVEEVAVIGNTHSNKELLEGE